MSLFFGYTVPGLHNELPRLRALLDRLPPTSALRRAIESGVATAVENYTLNAAELLHMLYGSLWGRSAPDGPRQVTLIHHYREYILSLTEEGVKEWNDQGAALLEHFVDPPEGDRAARNRRGIALTFLK
jgi:hypothetical protein